MRFRTEIEPIKTRIELSPNERIVLIGSCFADEIAKQLVLDGMNATGCFMGPLFNPLSIKRAIEHCGRMYNMTDLTEHEGIFHCLDWASRYRHTNPESLLEMVNTDFNNWSNAFAHAETIILTFGNTKIYETPLGVAGNCHKLPGGQFTERRLSVEDIIEAWKDVDFGERKVIVTLSPVRYTENGLAESNLAKATLRVAIDYLCKIKGWDYFPAYEILNDDLRDYRFYANDLKHPSEMAVKYIYDKFCETYMSSATREILSKNRKTALTLAHKDILTLKQ